MRARASSVARPGRSGRSPQRATWPATHGRAPGADRLNQSGGLLGPASRIAARRIMLLHDASTRTPAQVSSHRPQNRLCGDAPSPHAVTIRSPSPPAATTSAYAAGRPTATGVGIDASVDPDSQPAAPGQAASAGPTEPRCQAPVILLPRAVRSTRRTTARRSFDLNCEGRAQHLNREPHGWRNAPLT
jgi:hypothetical protein